MTENFHIGHLNTGPFFSDSTRLIYSSSISLRFDEYDAIVNYKTFEQTYEFEEGKFGLFVVEVFSGWLVAILIIIAIIKIFQLLRAMVREGKFKRGFTIAKVSGTVMFALLVITNPSPKDFKDYNTCRDERREWNFIIYSIYSSSCGSYYGVLNNFFEKEK